MIRIPKVTMAMREFDRLKCIQGLIDGQLKQTAVGKTPTTLRIVLRGSLTERGAATPVNHHDS